MNVNADTFPEADLKLINVSILQQQQQTNMSKVIVRPTVVRGHKELKGEIHYMKVINKAHGKPQRKDLIRTQTMSLLK